MKFSKDSRCSYFNCNFTTESERGLKVHIKRKHTQLEKGNFPKFVIFVIMNANKQSLTDQLKEHSYMNLKFKCEDFAFLAEDNIFKPTKYPISSVQSASKTS